MVTKKIGSTKKLSVFGAQKIMDFCGFLASIFQGREEK